MRNGQNKRMRGRHRKNQNPLTRVYESNGPDVKIRGTANHVAEKYIQLARDAQTSGDPVGAENYYQHAEHYFRLIAAAQEQFRQSQPFYQQQGPGGGDQQQQSRGGEDSFDDSEEDMPQGSGGEPHYPREPQQPYPPRDAQSFQQHQPYPPRDQQQPQQHQSQSQQPPQQQQPQGYRPQPSGGGEGSNVDRLPSFITGSQPQQNQGQQSFGPNGYDNQSDRFALHRRRRRGHHRGPRPDLQAGAPQGMGNDGPEEPTPPTPNPANE